MFLQLLLVSNKVVNDTIITTPMTHTLMSRFVVDLSLYINSATTIAKMQQTNVEGTYPLIKELINPF